MQWVQTEWAADWLATAHGFGLAANYLTDHREDFHAEIDQARVAIFFLQRHRVELLIKAIIDQHKIEVPHTHSLKPSWDVLKDTIRGLDDDTADHLAEQGDALIQLLDVAEASSMTFRYPVDKLGARSDRPDNINLEALNKRIEDFDLALTGAMDYLSETLEDPGYY